MVRRTIEHLAVRDVEKRRSPSKHYAFIMEVTWSDGIKTLIGRQYSCFFDLQTSLLERFPKESGQYDPTARIIPFLPGKILFGRSNTRDVALKRMGPISTYCMTLTKLPDYISTDSIVLDFFESGIGDNGITLGGSSSDKSPVKTANEITGPLILDKYVAIAAYKKDQKKELDLKEGEVLEVVEKRESGWWLVANEEGKNGWVPGVYLESLYGATESSPENERLKAGEGQKYTALYDHSADNTTDELSFTAGSEIEILEKNLEGWWFGRMNGKEGWVPASYLEESVIEKMAGADKRRNFGRGRQRTIREDRPPPKRMTFKRTLTKAQVAKVRTKYMKKQQSIEEADEEENISGVYTSISDFMSTIEDGISFKKDQMIQVLQKSDSGWWFAKIGDRQGWVPEAYLVKANAKPASSPKRARSPVMGYNSDPVSGERSPNFPRRPNPFGTGNSPLLAPKSPVLLGKPQRPPSPKRRSSPVPQKPITSLSPFEISKSAFRAPSPIFSQTNHLHGIQSNTSPRRYSTPDLPPDPAAPRLPARNNMHSPRKPSRALAAYEWYMDISRQEAEEALRYEEEEGFFIIRPSHRGSTQGKPYSLTMFHQGVTWNFHIRRRQEDGMFAVGAYKDDEPCFQTVADLVEYYGQNHMVIGEQENLVKLLGTPQSFYDKC